MKKEQVNYDNILNPEVALDDYSEKLFSLYESDYGRDNLDLIKKRMDETIYIFDSTPVDMVNYLVENEKHYGDCFRIDRAFDECRDYLKVKDKIAGKLRDRFYKILANNFETDKKIAEQLTELDIDSFSNASQEILDSEMTPLEVKNSIKLRREKYLSECDEVNVSALVDGNSIKKLFDIKDDFESEAQIFIMKHSKWGKRIRKQILEASGIKLSYEELTTLLLWGYSASSNVVLPYKNKTLRVCVFPLMKNFNDGNLDGIFFHENRHVVETEENFCGICSYDEDKYTILNEIRTEKNSCRDKFHLGDEVLFSNKNYDEGKTNIYLSLFPYAGDFFDRYEEILNKIAVVNDIEKLENLFGVDNLREFDEYLETLQNFLLEEPWKVSLYASEEKQKKLTLKLDRCFDSRQQ